MCGDARINDHPFDLQLGRIGAIRESSEERAKNYRLTFAGLPVESTGGSGPLLAAVQLSLGGSPGERLRRGEHHDVGGGGGPAGAPEGGAAGVGRLQHPRCGAAEREDDVRPLVLLLRLDARLPLLVLPQDSLPSFPLGLAYQPFSLLHLVSSARDKKRQRPGRRTRSFYSRAENDR